ncbi:MAG: protein phosphatase 2C domain-containing protein [Azoarcus sp.]|nr:protein phosphatase 2C domain-containing protein [Azoarcus sp.]
MRVFVESSVGRHIGDRKEQQDRVAVLSNPSLPGTLLVVLADGMGGHSGGAMAAEHVILAAQQNLDTFSPTSESPEQLLNAVVRDAHSAIRLSRFSSEQDPHSTAVAFLLHQGRALWAHCGDSRLYHFRNGELKLRTRDHSLVGELQRRGKLSEQEALSHPQRNVLVSCLGGDHAPAIEVGRCDNVVGGDYFLVCSDGLWNYFSDKELGDMLGCFSADDAAKQLFSMARERANGGGDNFSFAIVRVVPPRN